MIHSLLMQDRKGRYTHIHGCDNSLVIIQFDKLSCCHHFQGLGCVGFLFSIPQHLFERSSEWNFKDFWLQTGVNSNPPSLHVSFFPSFFRLFWKLLIFVSVNPTFLQLGVQFCWLCFLCLPCTYSVERRFVFRAIVFCAPTLIVVSMGQVFCCFSQILFWKQSQVPGSCRCKSVFVFITTG